MLDQKKHLRPSISFDFGDITKMNVDAIVNAGKRSLRNGGGVTGAIYRSANSTLRDELAALAPCATGSAVVSGSHGLPCKHIIHTVGPFWLGGWLGEDEKLAMCYRSVLELADALGLQSVAFPAISTGHYMFPTRRAAKVAARALEDYVRTSRGSVKEIILTFTDRRKMNIYRDAFTHLIDRKAA